MGTTDRNVGSNGRPAPAGADRPVTIDLTESDLTESGVTSTAGAVNGQREVRSAAEGAVSTRIGAVLPAPAVRPDEIAAALPDPLPEVALPEPGSAPVPTPPRSARARRREDWLGSYGVQPLLISADLTAAVLGGLLASLLTLDRLFTADHEDGSLDLIVMGRTPLELVCAAKALAHWIAAGLPLIVATPVLGLLLNLDTEATAAVALTLLAGTPALTLLGMIGAALAVTLRRGGLLLPILVLPLSIPTLIFGVIAANQAADGGSAFGAPFSILCALSLFGLVVGPFAAAASLRQGLD